MAQLFSELLETAGPATGWVLLLLLGGTILYLYITDRLTSPGRVEEIVSHYEQQVEQERRHAAEMLRAEADRADALQADRDYWRDGLLDLMSHVAQSSGTRSEDPS